MASVLKRFNHFKGSPFHSQSTSSSSSSSSSCGDKRSPSPSVPPKGNEEEVAIPTDLLNRRKVSISKSGRYRENHKKRSALPNETKDPQSSPSRTSASVSSPNGTPSKGELRSALLMAKDKSHDGMEEKNKENEKNRENTLARRDSIISDTDGHAVADEIESLAKTMTMENSTETAL